jgi:cation diffusion facilitator family transporter
LSVASNSLLVVGKLIIGVMIGSVSVVSEAIHSGVDLVAAVIALVAVRTSGKPADEEHPFGHGKIENISGAIEAILIFLAAGWIIYEAVHKLIRPEPLEEVGWGVGVMFVSAAMNLFVSHMLFKVARRTDSIALEADAWHLRTDVWTSAGVTLGLTLILVSEKVFPGRHFHWLDPLFAIGVALLIVKAAWDLTAQAGRDLLDTNIGADEQAWVKQYLHDLEARSQTTNIFGYHRLRTRKSGHTRFVEFHLFVNPQMTVEKGHQITQTVKADIRRRLPGSDVLIHIEPYDPRRDSKRHMVAMERGKNATDAHG